MRPDDLYLVDIVTSCDAVARFVSGRDLVELGDDDLLGSAVLHKLSVIGEAAARVSETTRRRRPDAAWRQAAGLRNVLVHAYFAVDWDVIREVITADLPPLRAAAAELLAGGRPGEP